MKMTMMKNSKKKLLKGKFWIKLYFSPLDSKPKDSYKLMMKKMMTTMMRKTTMMKSQMGKIGKMIKKEMVPQGREDMKRVILLINPKQRDKTNETVSVYNNK